MPDGFNETDELLERLAATSGRRSYLEVKCEGGRLLPTTPDLDNRWPYRGRGRDVWDMLRLLLAEDDKGEPQDREDYTKFSYTKE